MTSGSDTVQDDTDGAAPDAIPLSLLADLQAGLLDDETAAEVRHRARTDPDVAHRLAALSRVRRDVAALGTDADSAPAVPAETTARIGAALRTLSGTAPPLPTNRVISPTVGAGSAHAARPGPRLRTVAAVAGAAAAVAATALGTTTLLGDSARRPATDATASFITVSRAPGAIPLDDRQILALLKLPPDLSGLADPQRRTSCLSGLGYPTTTTVLGARPLDVDGRPGILVLLPGDTPHRVVALVVAPDCNSADTGMLASSVVTRP